MYFLNAFLLPVIQVQLWAHFDSLFLTQQKTAPAPKLWKQNLEL